MNADKQILKYYWILQNHCYLRYQVFGIYNNVFFIIF